MDERKNAIIRAMTEIECYPVAREETPISDYTRISMGELSAFGAVVASAVPIIRSFIGSGPEEQLYRMRIDGGLKAGERLVMAKNGGFLGNVVNADGVLTKRARYEPVSGVSTVLQLNPAIMMMAVAIKAITHKLDKIEEAQKEILAFLQLKEKARLKGNVAVLQEILDEYKYNWSNEKYKVNKHIQVQEIKRDAEQSIVFCREQIEKVVSKKGFWHSDRDVKKKIEGLQYVFKDYELSMYIFAFSSFLEVMLLENFDAGYLEAVVNKIEAYAEQYHILHAKCYEVMELESKTTVQSYILKGVAGLNHALGNTIGKIPKIRDGQVDETLIGAGDKVQSYSEKRTEKAMELFSNEYCTCVRPFVENIKTVNQVYNEPLDMLFDGDNIYFCLTEEKTTNEEKPLV